MSRTPAPTPTPTTSLVDGNIWTLQDARSLAAKVAADPRGGVYRASTTDNTKVWVRQFDGPYHARWWGFAPSNSDTANAVAGQAAINTVYDLNGGELWFPAGASQHSGLIFKNKIKYRGAGRDWAAAKGTVLLYTGTGDGIQVNNPVNGSTAANYSVEGFTFLNLNANAGKGSFADTGSTDIKFRECVFAGSDRGLIFDQTELADCVDCEFVASASGATCGVWIVNGGDRTLGADAGYANRISISRSQINGSSTAYGIVDDGGNTHSFVDNNYNGCLKHIRAAGVTGLKIDGGEFESAAQENIEFNFTSLAGNSVGQCSTVKLSGAEIIPSSGQHCVVAYSLAGILLDGVVFGNTTATKFAGSANCNLIQAAMVNNEGGGATFDGVATNHIELRTDGSIFLSGAIIIDGNQVVGARQTKPATPTLADVVTLLDTHGLWA